MFPLELKPNSGAHTFDIAVLDLMFNNSVCPQLRRVATLRAANSRATQVRLTSKLFAPVLRRQRDRLDKNVMWAKLGYHEPNRWIKTMDIWDEIFYAVLDNDDDSSVYSSSAAASQPAPSEFMRNLFMSAAKDTALPDLLTVLVKSDWCVPVDAANSLQSLVAEPGEYRLILEEETKPKSKNKSKNKKADSHLLRQKNGGGRGGELVPLYMVLAESSPGDQPSTTKTINGREIIRTIPAHVDGLLVQIDKETPFEIPSEHFTLMRTIADECDLEEMIVSPQPGQVDKLMQAKWWVEVEGDEVVPKQMLDHKRVVYARVREDRLGLSFSTFKHMSGEQLFDAVYRNPEAHGLVVDELLGSPDQQFFTPLYSLECIGNLLKGNDTRVGVKPLPPVLWKKLNCGFICEDFRTVTVAYSMLHMMVRR